MNPASHSDSKVSNPSAIPFHLPAEIEARSMAIIEEELRSMGVSAPEENLPVLKRVIHTTADFDYAKNLVFTPDAVALGRNALRQGTPIVTDTNMARAGINKPALDGFGSQVYCFMADPEVAEAARLAGTTRAVASMEKASSLWPEAIYAIGNAPTALYALAEKIEAGMRPSLIIAVPVGFVNVTEAKEAILECCRRHGIPVIAALGRKGGSTVAAAICNALLYAAKAN